MILYIEIVKCDKTFLQRKHYTTVWPTERALNHLKKIFDANVVFYEDLYTGTKCISIIIEQSCTKKVIRN